MKFRKFKSGELQNKIKQQYEVAKEVQDTIKKANLKNCEEGFNLAKEILLSNERFGTLSILKEVFSAFSSGGFKWLGFTVTFLLGILATMITDNDTNSEMVKCVIELMILGYVLDVVRKLVSKNGEKMTVRILKNMTYERYRFLVDSEEEVEDAVE